MCWWWWWWWIVPDIGIAFGTAEKGKDGNAGIEDDTAEKDEKDECVLDADSLGGDLLDHIVGRGEDGGTHGLRDGLPPHVEGGRVEGCLVELFQRLHLGHLLCPRRPPPLHALSHPIQVALPSLLSRRRRLFFVSILVLVLPVVLVVFIVQR